VKNGTMGPSTLEVNVIARSGAFSLQGSPRQTVCRGFSSVHESSGLAPYGEI
jgi:hypothetical protein